MLDSVQLDRSRDFEYGYDDKQLRKEILGKINIDGSSFSSISIPPHGQLALYGREDEIRLLIFYADECEVEYLGEKTSIDEVAVFVQHPKEPVVLYAGNETIRILELILDMKNDEDIAEMKNLDIASTGLFCYSDSPVYSEDIKSSKTISRTLLPGNIVPRISIGSVYTEGEDMVAEHTHPMLEQFFLSLEKNDSTILVDGEKTLFPQNTIVHIPLGSKHGVSVDTGKTLHYLWIDVFKDAGEMTYLEEHHMPSEESRV